MKINTSKTQLIVLCNSYNVSQIGQISLEFDGSTIVSQDCIKTLDLKLDSKLSWYDHINGLSKKYHFVAKSLYPLKPVLSLQNYLKIATVCKTINKMDILDSVCHIFSVLSVSQSRWTFKICILILPKHNGYQKKSLERCRFINTIFVNVPILACPCHCMQYN